MGEVATYSFISVARGNSSIVYMTQPTSDQNSESPQNNSANPPIRTRINASIQRMFGRKRAILIKRNSIEIHWFDFSDKRNLPFDPETYENTQIFIGNWANPWYVDIDSIKEAYPDFTEENITKVEDVFAKNHVYPSQKYKLFMNQQVLKDMFVGGPINNERIMRLLYAITGGIVVIAILLLTGGGA